MKPLAPIVISPPSPISEEMKILTCLFEEGLETFHLRKPGASEGEVRKYLESIPSSYHNRIVLHSHWGLGGTYNVKGFHGIGAGISGRRVTRSCSLHSLHEASSVYDFYDYALLSPVFDSISKPDYHSAFEPLELEIYLKKKWLQPSIPPLAALGGIDASNCHRVLEWGFDGVALLGAVWQNSDTRTSVNQFKKVRDICQINLTY